MKKLFITLFLAVMAIGANAQVTWNVRAGIGIINGVMEYNYGDYKASNTGTCPVVAVESNITISGDYVFSPSIIASLGADVSDTHHKEMSVVSIPLLFGKKFFIGGNRIFIPKVGPVIINQIKLDEGLKFGPAAECAFELNKIVVAINGNFNVINSFTTQASLTVGYKF